jgi:hypothetical protein
VSPPEAWPLARRSHAPVPHIRPLRRHRPPRSASGRVAARSKPPVPELRVQPAGTVPPSSSRLQPP